MSEVEKKQEKWRAYWNHVIRLHAALRIISFEINRWVPKNPKDTDPGGEIPVAVLKNNLLSFDVEVVKAFLVSGAFTGNQEKTDAFLAELDGSIVTRSKIYGEQRAQDCWAIHYNGGDVLRFNNVILEPEPNKRPRRSSEEERYGIWLAPATLRELEFELHEVNDDCGVLSLALESPELVECVIRDYRAMREHGR